MIDNIIFKRSIDQARSNRGWVVYRINALLNDEDIGHITFSYISDDNWRKYYPSAIFYALRIAGIGKSFDDLSLDKDDIRRVAWSIYSKYNWYEANILNNQIPNMSDVEVKALQKRLNREVYSKYRKQIKDFKERFVNNPQVDYIYVNEDYRNKGFGKLLYLEAGKWLSELGLELRASQLQSDSAKVVWNGFIKSGIAYISDSKQKWIKLKMNNFISN
jgi:GNAT superfamily N-acetyltransferase